MHMHCKNSEKDNRNKLSKYHIEAFQTSLTTSENIYKNIGDKNIFRISSFSRTLLSLVRSTEFKQ